MKSRKKLYIRVVIVLYVDAAVVLNTTNTVSYSLRNSCYWLEKSLYCFCESSYWEYWLRISK